MLYITTIDYFCTKIDMIMRHEEVNIQTLTKNKGIHVGYSDNDIVIIDSIQGFVEIGSAHVSMISIVVCLSGKVQAQMNGKTIVLAQNQIAVIPPNTTVTDLMITPNFELKAMFITNTILQSFLREKMNVWNEMMYIQSLHIIDISEEDIQFFNRFYEILQMRYLKSEDMPYRKEIIQSLLRGAMLALCATMRQIAPLPIGQHPIINSSSGYFQRFLDLLHSASHHHRTVESYANELCISPKYLTIVCKKHSGKTAGEWIREQLLEEIRYYLQQTDLNIKQICDRLGFPNTSFFGKYVKDHFGMPPIQFRNAFTRIT